MDATAADTAFVQGETRDAGDLSAVRTWLWTLIVLVIAMVASGLKPGMVAVAPIKLATHLTLASIILAGLVTVATRLGPRREAGAPARVLKGARFIVGLVLAQIALGGLVAGSKAGFTFNTWPLMDGRLIPPASTLFAGTPFIENFVDNVALVQFNHRLLAYGLVAFAIWHAIRASRMDPGARFARQARVVAGLCLAQGVLGVVTLILVVPLWAGLAHQVFAMLVLAMAVVHATATRVGDHSYRRA